ncbi:MAG: hypothetical protein JSS39_03215 [Nitrospira sp.]|nr:hypothetical protein [Nitrospira sp.]
MTHLMQTFTSQLSLWPFFAIRLGTIHSRPAYSCLFALPFVLLGLVLTSAPAQALEKYGRPLPSLEGDKNKETGGKDIRETEETLFGGYFLTAAFVSNPTFAARPDNTGLVGLRHMAHFETDLYKQYLTFYTDQNFFSDRTKGWITLTEWDMTYALTGLVGRWSWRIQYERDAPLDRSGIQQIYADTLVTRRFLAAEDLSWWQSHFPNQNITAYAGMGWLFYNSNYYARPDNTGLALFRYVAHFDANLYKNMVVFFGDFNLFTDRELSNKLKPTELDWIVGVAVRFKDDYEVSVYREQDRSLDKPGSLVQEYWAVQLRVAFDVPKRMLSEMWPSK